jgi:MFS family permease
MTGGLTDIMRVKHIWPIVLAVLAGSCLLMAFNPWAALLPVVIFCLRLSGQGIPTYIATVAMSRWFVANRGKALSIANPGFSLGAATFPLLVVGLLVYFAWQEIWIITAVLELLSIPTLIWLLRRERSPQSMATENQSKGKNKRHWTRNETLVRTLFWFMVPSIGRPICFQYSLLFSTSALCKN